MKIHTVFFRHGKIFYILLLLPTPIHVYDDDDHDGDDDDDGDDERNYWRLLRGNSVRGVEQVTSS